MSALVEDSSNCVDPVASSSPAYDCFADNHKRKAHRAPSSSHFGIEMPAWWVDVTGWRKYAVRRPRLSGDRQCEPEGRHKRGPTDRHPA